MSRRLTKDERELWERLRQSVKPLRRKRAADKPAAAANGRPAAAERPKPARPTPAAPKLATSPPSLSRFEEKTLRRLGRGLLEIDARIDLHGMRQERAFSMLGSFLRHQQARGARIVLVVTGKGKAGDEGRGVLRQSVPAWLSRPDLRDLVVGFEESNRRHGGTGALYVQIRRRREARRSAAAP